MNLQNITFQVKTISMLRHKKWELRCTAFEEKLMEFITYNNVSARPRYLGIPAITMDEQKKLAVKVYYSPTNAQVIVLKTILNFTLK
jgi:hypothetical protein